MKTAEVLNPLTLPLQKTCLVEASAGTGKTHVLTILYLRLLLGLGGKAAFLRPLSITEILVVTFTDAASEELRNRIRHNIHQLRLACMCGKSDDPLLAALLTQLNDHKVAAMHLLKAEQQIDEVTIFTIHGFCQRVLNFNAVECGILFQQTLLEDETLLLQQVSADFWRRHCYPLQLEVARMVQQHWQGPEDLLKELIPYLHGESPEIHNPPVLNESIMERHVHIIADIDNLKQQWRAAKTEILIILNTHKLDYRIYNSKNLSYWLAKINYWAEQPTINYQVPNELKRFTSGVLAEKTTDGVPPNHKLFTAIQTFFQNRTSLYDLIFMMALAEIRQMLAQEKQRRAALGFNDLLSHLDRALNGINGETLAKSIRTSYPVAMIDEFQDTDPQQYRIFHSIYGGKLDCALLLIGDPKQAIYSFRGADIFTYMRARNEVDIHYTLNTNWRSAPGMVNAINQLFQSLPTPFIFNNISFLPVVAAKNNTCLRLVIKQQPQPALRIWLQPGIGVNVREYQQCMAQQCATTICNWLNAASNRDAWLEGQHGQQLLQASDITVLVRNRHEATLIRDALATLLIPTVYLSNHDSVFETLEARELLWILQAVLTPEKNTTLCTALATNLLGFDASAINALHNDEQRWEQQIEEFAGYLQQWQTKGVLPMLRQIIINYHIAENLLASQNGERRLTDVLHLGELLQEASTELENEYALIHWLALQIASPSQRASNQQLRLESDRNLVQIITIHKSKGLEFPLVFLPFAADFRMKKQPLFHDRISYNAKLDLCASQESMQLAEEERLAEDLRLLYVALTRSIYHCSIGIAPIYYGNRKKTGASDLHLSAPGYLIQQGENGNANDLRKRLVALSNRADGDIVLCEAQATLVQPLALATTPTRVLSARRRPKIPSDPWQVTSYSRLQQHGSSVIMELQQQLDIVTTTDSDWQDTLQLTPHTFPRGAAPGAFLHSLFETLEFNKPVNSQWINKQLTQHGIDTIWLPVVINWIKKIIAMPLDGGSLSLTHITSDNRLVELQFYLPINTLVQAHNIDQICKHYDPLSARCPPLDFPQVKGMLTGFIDLVFRWQNRYYLLDYKSNWLGEKSATYTRPAMEHAMAANRYDLQYQLYTLALHRYLRHRLLDYHYARDFGGVYYLFLRGIDETMPKNGIYYCRPNSSLINDLDTLFTGVGVT